jgi:hypothetical protein
LKMTWGARADNPESVGDVRLDAHDGVRSGIARGPKNAARNGHHSITSSATKRKEAANSGGSAVV